MRLYKALVKEKTGADFPEDPRQQLQGATLREKAPSWSVSTDVRNPPSSVDKSTAVQARGCPSASKLPVTRVPPPRMVWSCISSGRAENTVTAALRAVLSAHERHQASAD